MISIIKKFLKISDEDSKLLQRFISSKPPRNRFKQINIIAFNATVEKLISLLEDSKNKPIWFEEFKEGFYSKGSCTGLEMYSMRNYAFKLLLEKYENKIPNDDYDLIVFLKYVSFDCWKVSDTNEFDPTCENILNSTDIINMPQLDSEFLDIIDLYDNSNNPKDIELQKKLGLLYIKPPLFLDSKELISEVYRLRGNLVLKAVQQLGLKDADDDYNFFERYANLNFFYARLYKGDYDIYKITKKYL